METQPPPECYNILKTYDILYFTFLTPYRIHYRNESKRFELLWRGKCSQAIVFLVYILCFVPYFLTFATRVVNEQRREFKYLCDNYSWLLWSLHLLNFLRVLWTRGEAVTSILNLMTENHLDLAKYSCHTATVITRTKVRLVQFAIVALGFCWTLIDIRLNIWNFLASDFSVEFCRLIRALERMWELEESNVIVNMCTLRDITEKVPRAHLGISIFMLAGYMVSELLTRVIEVSCLSYVMSFYWASKSFQYVCLNCITMGYHKVCKRVAGIRSGGRGHKNRSGERCCNPSAFSHILRTFFRISHLTDTINNAFGSAFTGVCFVALPIYAVKLETLVESGLENWNTAQFVMYAIFIPGILLTAAAGHSQLHSFPSWLQKVHRRKPAPANPLHQSRGSNTVQLVLSELEKNQIGIQGRGFTITYGFVGNILSLILTYSVVILQIQMPALK